MFTKADSRNSDNALETFLGAESSFQGTLRAKGSVRIDGKIEGGVAADGVIVGDQGEIQGDISARKVVIGGKVNGNVHASETLELSAKSQVFGDLHAPQLVIAEGAVFEGSCLMASEKAKVVEIAAKA